MIFDTSPGGSPFYLDPSPGVSLEDLMKQAGVYDDYMELIKQQQDGK